MRMMVHDLNEQEFVQLFPRLPEDIQVIADNGTIKSCIGCFGCWIKTPGRCVIKDGYETIGELLAGSDEMILISRCCFGSNSPFIKNVLDRGISYILPYFTNRKNGEMHHQKRYNHWPRLTVHFYGEDITEAEKLTAQKLVEAQALNMNIADFKVSFYHTAEELGGIVS